MFAGIRIVTLVRLQLILIGAVLLGLLSNSIWLALEDRSTASHIARVQAAADLASSLSFAVRDQEIQLVLAAAQAREGRQPFVRAADEFQQAAVSYLEELVAHMNTYGLREDSRFNSLLAEVEGAMHSFQSQRPGLVANVMEGATNPDVRRLRIEETMRALNTSASSLAVRLQNSMRELDPAVAQQIGVYQHADMLWDVMAEQRKDIATRLSSTGSLQGLDRDELQAEQERARALWNRMNQLAEASVAVEKLRPALQDAAEEYYSRYNSTVDGILTYRVRDDGITFAEWRSIVMPAVDAVVAIGSATSEAMSEIVRARLSHANQLLVINSLLGLFSFLVIGQMFLLMQARLIRPVRQLVDSISDLSRGNLNKEIVLKGKKDEIGEIASALENLRKEGLKARQAEQERMREQEVRARRGQHIEQIIRQFNESFSNALDQALKISREVNVGARQLHEAAEKVRTQSEFVDQSSEQATHNVQTVASASEELAASIHEINNQIEQSRMLSEEAVQKSRETSAKVNSLSESAARIDTVRQLITDIAEKTNLLALNAAIEAARAGEAGKGFNIVASEVKDLAKQTADATSEIDRQIRAMEMDTREVVEGSETIESFISRVNEAIATIASAAEQQSAATQEISRSVQDAAAGNRQVNDGTAEVRRVAEETNEMAARMLNLAEDLDSQGRRLKQDVSEFLKDVREV